MAAMMQQHPTKSTSQPASQLAGAESAIERINGRLTLIDRVARWRISIKCIVAAQQTSRRLVVGGLPIGATKSGKAIVCARQAVIASIGFSNFSAFPLLGKCNEKSLNKRHDSRKQITVIYFAPKWERLNGGEKISM